MVKKSADDGKGRFDELLYAEKLRKNLPPVKTVEKEWYAYREKFGAWKLTPRAEFEPQAARVCPKRHRKHRNWTSLLDHLQGTSQLETGEFPFRGFSLIAAEKDGMESVLVNAANGVVKVWPEEVASVEKHDREHRFTTTAAAAYDESATCGLFEEVLCAALPDPADRELLQIFCGSILYPSSKYETCLVFHGTAGTSKSTIAEAVVHALIEPEDTSNLVTSLKMSEICNSTAYSLPQLHRAALNLGTEADTVELEESTNFKQIVSGESIQARRIYGAPITMRTTCKLWFLSNDLPRFKHGSAAELRRLRLLHFTVTPSLKDPSLKERLRAERDGIFRWMVDGLIKLMARKAIPDEGEKSGLLRRRFALSNDPVTSFVKARCVLDATAQTPKKWLEDSFGSFVEENGLSKNLQDTFLRRLYERYSPDVKPWRSRVTEQGVMRVEHVVKGIRLADTSEEAD